MTIVRDFVQDMSFHTHTLTYDILKYYIARNVAKIADTRITSAIVVGVLFNRRRRRRREREVREWQWLQKNGRKVF